MELLSKSGRGEEVPKLLGKLESVDATSSDYAFYRGLYEESQGEYRTAIDLYRKAASRDDQNVEAYFRLGYLLDLHGTENEYANDEAVVAYENCLKVVPMHTNAVINLGVLYEDRERYHDAIKCFQTVLKQCPNHARARLYLGDAVAATRMFYDKEQEDKADSHRQVLNIPLGDFELSVRSRNRLQKMQIDTLGDLIMKTEQQLLSFRTLATPRSTRSRKYSSRKNYSIPGGLGALNR